MLYNWQVDREDELSPVSVGDGLDGDPGRGRAASGDDPRALCLPYSSGGSPRWAEDRVEFGDPEHHAGGLVHLIGEKVDVGGRGMSDEHNLSHPTSEIRRLAQTSILYTNCHASSREATSFFRKAVAPYRRNSTGIVPPLGRRVCRKHILITERIDGLFLEI